MKFDIDGADSQVTYRRDSKFIYFTLRKVWK